MKNETASYPLSRLLFNEKAGYIIRQGFKKSMPSLEEIQNRLKESLTPLGKDSVLEKIEPFLQKDLSLLKNDEKIWVVESISGLGTTFLMEEIRQRVEAKGLGCVLWTEHHPRLPADFPFVWLIDDLSKISGGVLNERFLAWTSKLKEIYHKGENKPWLTVIGGFGKMGQLPQDLQALLRGRSKRFQLLPWTRVEIERWLKDLFQSSEAPPFLAEKLEKESGGNPKKIVHLLQHYLEKKLILDRKGNWRKDLFHPTPLFTDQFSEDPQYSEFDSLFEKMTSEEKKILVFLSFLFEPAPLKLLENLTTSPSLLQSLHRLCSRGLVSGGGKEPYQIARTGLKNYVWDHLTPSEIEKQNDFLLKLSQEEETQLFFSREAVHSLRAHGSDPLLSAQGWASFGEAAARRGLAQSAYEYFTKAYDRTPAEHHEKRLEYAVERGKYLVALHRFSEAKAFFETLLKVFEDQKHSKPALFSKIYERLGLLEMKQGNKAYARELFQKSLECLEPTDEPLEQYLGVRNFMASLDLREGRIQEAIQEFQKNYDLSLKKLPWEKRRILTNNDLGEALLQNGRLEEAIAHWKECVKDLKIREDKTPLTRCYYQMCLAYLKQGDAQKALHYLNGALKNVHGLQNFELEARIHNTMGNIFREENPEKAFDSYEKALEAAFQTQDPLATAAILLNMGCLLSFLKEWEKAEHSFHQGLLYLSGVREEEKQKRLFTHLAQLELAKLSLALNRNQEGLKFAKEAMTAAEKYSELKEHRFDTLLTLHHALQKAQKTDEAHRSLKILRKLAATPEEKKALEEIS